MTTTLVTFADILSALVTSFFYTNFIRMRNVNNPRHKLDSRGVEDARALYEEKGWKMAHIAVFLGVNRSSIFYHIQFDGWVRRVPVVSKMPEEVVEVYRLRKKTRSEVKLKGSYAYAQHREEQARLKRQSQCEHKLFIISCSCCGKIVGSDSIQADPHVLEVMQRQNGTLINNIEPSLCLK